MKKLVVSILIAFLGNNASAQSIGSSPYASYGIGDIKYDNSIEIRSMGGISSAYVSDFNNGFNFQNPATNGNLEITSIKIQGTNENLFLKSNNTNKHKNSTYLSGISIAFPISKKIKFGVGYQPYSSKDYNISEDTQKHFGEGNINIVQAGIGYAFTPEFSFGVTSNLYFGKLYDTKEISNNNSTITSEENVIGIHNFNFTLGSIYQKKFKNNKKLTFGATYTLGNTSNLKSTYTHGIYSLVNNEKNYQSKTTEINKNVKNPLGNEFSFGVGLGHDSKWFISSQFNYKQNITSNNIIFNQDFEYQNAYRVSVGGWYLPNANNFRNYFSRVIYRYGAFYGKENLKINNADINKYGIAFGGSFPFQKSNINRLSTIDLGVELGQRGSLKSSNKENFLNLTIGINFAHKWFDKQYYD